MGINESVPDAGFHQPRDLIDAFAEALNAKDAEGLGKLFPKTPSLSTSGERACSGVRASSRAT
jgi:hypothetical protein